MSDLRADLEMFSSYVVSSVTSDDALYSVKYRKRVDDVTIHLNQASLIVFIFALLCLEELKCRASATPTSSCRITKEASIQH